MAYFRNLEKQLVHLLSLFSKEDRWLITIIADPDAVASAIALRRIMQNRVKSVTIASPTEMTRPDNLSMLKFLRISLEKFTPELALEFDKFAIVDSQPDHHPLFQSLDYSIIIDHHPEKEDIQYEEEGKFINIRPNYGATATMMTEFLYNLDINITPRIATALQLGIRTDTGMFERSGAEVDMRAYQYLSKFANPDLRSHILKSQYKISWLPYFSMAFANFIAISGKESEIFTYLPEVETADILVAIADFCMRIQEVSWVAVAGRVDQCITIIFRGGALEHDLGQLAALAFDNIGSAGGHRNIARAEIPFENIPQKINIVEFLLREIADALDEIKNTQDTEEDDES